MGSVGKGTLANVRLAVNGNVWLKLLMTAPLLRSKNTPQPPRNTVSFPPAWRSRYAAPTRGAMLSYVVRYIGVPGGASAIAAGSAVVSVNASSLLFNPGGGSMSQRTPYVSVSSDVADHVS